MRVATVTVHESAPSVLQEQTARAFTPRAPKESPLPFAGILTTEACDLSCVMCHFNGPQATKKVETLGPALVDRALQQLAPGQEVPFAATGEFLLESHALEHLRAARDRGLRPWVLTHGQLLTAPMIDEILAAGVRLVRISADSTDPAQYRKIRRGGELSRILEACATLRLRKAQYPDLRVEINCTLFRNTFPKQDEMVEFWRGKVDQVNFNAEYYDTFKYRNIFFVPERRVDCKIQMYVLPSGRITPCCAMTVYAHDHDVSWLPHVAEDTLDEAYDKLRGLYEDPASPLGKLCAKCDWWIMWANDAAGNTPYLRCVALDVEKPGWYRRLRGALGRLLRRRR